MPERSGAGTAASIDASRVAELIARERAAYGERHPSSRQAFAAAGANVLGTTARSRAAAGRYRF
jgi:hypothetical protein